MADTSSAFINGKDISSGVTSPTGGDISEQIRSKVIEITSFQRTGKEPVSEESIEPAKLYEYFSPETGQFVVDAPLGLISKALGVSLQRLRDAVQEQDELEKENHIAMCWSNLFGLVQYLGNWPTFDEVLALLFAAFESHRSFQYDTADLVALQRVLEVVRRNPLPTESELLLIYDSLEAAKFDLNLALAHTDLTEATEDK